MVEAIIVTSSVTVAGVYLIRQSWKKLAIGGKCGCGQSTAGTTAAGNASSASTSRRVTLTVGGKRADRHPRRG